MLRSSPRAAERGGIALHQPDILAGIAVDRHARGLRERRRGGGNLPQERGDVDGCDGDRLPGLQPGIFEDLLDQIGQAPPFAAQHLAVLANPRFVVHDAVRKVLRR